MKNYTITKEQLRKITDPQVKEWFPDAFDNFKKGDWIYSKDAKYLVCIVDKKNAIAYGFTDCRSWRKGNGDVNGWDFNHEKSKCRLATKEEVTEALTKEAIKRGLVKGVEVTKINPRNIGNNQNQKPFEIVTDNYWLTRSGFYNDNICLMDLKGNWAEVVQTITKAEAEKILNKKIVG